MAKKKIMIIGSDHPAALELVFKDQLDRNNFHTTLFPAQTIFLNYYNQSLRNKILFRLGFSRIINNIQESLKSFIILENPAFILVFKGMEVMPSTICWIKARGIKICNYNPDNPFVFSGKGSGNKYVVQSFLLFDFYISYSEEVVNKLLDYGVRSFKLPFGFDSDGFVYSDLNPDAEIFKCCFLGNADNQRVVFLNGLAKLGLEIDVYGENWDRFDLHITIKVGRAKYGEDFWRTLQMYAVQLNLLRPHNFAAHNMRSFDIPGAGGIMLAPLTGDHRSFFSEENEIFLFDSLSSAFEQANKILKLSFEERLHIRRRARQRALELHTYRHRVIQLMNII